MQHENAIEPAPLRHGDLRPFFDDLERGLGFRAAFERLLRHLPEERADRLTQLLKESRGAWLTVLCTRGGEALVVGAACSGSAAALARAGFAVTLLDPSRERLRFALAAFEAFQVGRVRGLVGGRGRALPFAARAFDLVVLEQGLPDERFAPALDECRRVCRGQLFVMADNRLAYKRSGGGYHDFRLTRPLEYARALLRPRRGERTLRGYRAALAAAGFAPARAFALYPHRRDFTHVVALDERLPELPLGPNERRNKLKLLARAAGLFPVLAPSFGLVSARRELCGRPSRIAHVLEELARRVGEPTPAAEQVTGTRGDTIVVQTALAGGRAGEPAGRWTLHVALVRAHEEGLRLHLRMLALLRERFPGVPAPEPLFAGPIDGLWLSCERRLPGTSAIHQVGRRARAEAILGRVAGHLAQLVVRPPATFSEADFDELLEPAFELVARGAADAGTRAALAGMRARARAGLVGHDLPRTLCHGDLRAKHVQVDAAGEVLGYLDWGAASDCALPYYDLLHLFVHDRQQARGRTEGEIWRALVAREGLRPAERAAFERYREEVGLDEEAARALEAIYPVFVGRTAETHWRWSRPRWLARRFDL